MSAFNDKEFIANLRNLCVVIIEQCAEAVDMLPVSASLYEDAKTAKAVLAFKTIAVEEIRSLAASDAANALMKEAAT